VEEESVGQSRPRVVKGVALDLPLRELCAGDVDDRAFDDSAPVRPDEAVLETQTAAPGARGLASQIDRALLSLRRRMEAARSSGVG
jgi:hypothetical protein